MSEPVAISELLPDVEYHCLRISQPSNDYGPDSSTMDLFGPNGLAGVEHGLLLIATGIAQGVVRLTVAMASAPVPVNDAPWDDIVEVSLPIDEEVLVVPTREPPAYHRRMPLPPHSGLLRVRVYARGREIAYDGVTPEPVEDYRLDIWPAPESPQAMLKHSGEYGASLRLAYQQERGAS